MQDSHSESIRDVGPILHLRGTGDGTLRIAALVITRRPAVPVLRTATSTVTAEPLGRTAGHHSLRYDFTLPASRNAWYELGGTRYEVATDVSNDMRIAFVSCNGQEHGDLKRSEEERNLMWQRLAQQHRERPFSLMLHGGDQLYADEVTEAHPISRDWPKTYRNDLAEPEAAALLAALREAFFHRYLTQMAQPGFAWLAARVPSVTIWDDHDICDGWGSLKAKKLDSDVGRILFAAAREFFLLFQLCVAPDEVPRICSDQTGGTLTWSVALPGLTLVAPDLRSERRRERVMGESGWRAFRSVMKQAEPGKLLVISSVPALGPRLSILERLMRLTPWMEKYEDDLRDQWQSYSHRPEWQDFLRVLVSVHERPATSVTVLSGEIHLATRGTMTTAAGDLHQLVASGIAHPAPSWAYAAGLGALARLGEAPLPGHPIRLLPLPGKQAIYTAERNYLVLERVGGAWTAVWELEDSGPTPPLPI
jgi:hypothetical protein